MGAQQMMLAQKIAAGGGGSSPAWVGEITAARKTETASAGTTTLTTNTEVPAGSRIVVTIWSYFAAGQSVSSVSDGTNTYTLDKALTWGNSSDTKIQIASALVAAPLASGSTITVTWASPASSNRAVMAGYISNSTGAVDASASGTSISTSPSASASTTVDGVAVGIVMLVDVTKTYTSTWDAVGALLDYASLRTYYITETTVAGTNNPAGSTSSSTRWAVAWVNYP